MLIHSIIPTMSRQVQDGGPPGDAAAPPRSLFYILYIICYVYIICYILIIYIYILYVIY